MVYKMAHLFRKKKIDTSALTSVLILKMSLEIAFVMFAVFIIVAIAVEFVVSKW